MSGLPCAWRDDAVGIDHLRHAADKRTRLVVAQRFERDPPEPFGLRQRGDQILRRGVVLQFARAPGEREQHRRSRQLAHRVVQQRRQKIPRSSAGRPPARQPVRSSLAGQRRHHRIEQAVAIACDSGSRTPACVKGRSARRIASGRSSSRRQRSASIQKPKGRTISASKARPRRKRPSAAAIWLSSSSSSRDLPIPGDTAHEQDVRPLTRLASSMLRASCATSSSRPTSGTRAAATGPCPSALAITRAVDALATGTGTLSSRAPSTRPAGGPRPSSRSKMRQHCSYWASASRRRPSAPSTLSLAMCPRSFSGLCATSARAWTSACSGLSPWRSTSAARICSWLWLAASRSARHHSWYA